MCNFFSSLIRDLVIKPDLTFPTEAAPSAFSRREDSAGDLSGNPSHPVCLCTGSTLNTAVALGRLHQTPLCPSPSLYKVRDPYNGAIWMSRAVFCGYWDVGRRQWVPVSDQATRAVFMHGKVKAELQASFSCKGRRGAEPRLNNKVMLQVGSSSYNLCNCLCWELQRPWWEGEGFPCCACLAASACLGFFSRWM